MGITIIVAINGWINFEIAAAIVLGENIGTTVTAWLASLGANLNAKRAARAHLIFNVAGVCWMLALFSPFIAMVDAVMPGSIHQSDITQEEMQTYVAGHPASKDVED
jgi:phosphate:Na+ symporter